MKIVLFVILALLLSGCSQQVPPTTQPPEGLYDATHPTQNSPGSPWKAYALENYDYQRLAAMGEDYLMFSPGKLTLLSGENMVPVRTVSIPETLKIGCGQLQVNENGVGYFDFDTQTVAYLSRNLGEVGRLHLTTAIPESACLAPGWNELYYCTSDGVQVMDLRTGASRTLARLSPGNHSLAGLEAEGTLLHGTTVNADGTVSHSLISVKTGQTVYQGDTLANFFAWGDRYYLTLAFGPQREYIFGKGEEPAYSLFLNSEDKTVWLPENHALLRMRRTGAGVSLDYYDLSSGCRSAAIDLEGTVFPWGICADGKYVWMRLEDTLYRWDPSGSPTKDTAIHTAPHYTREQPDEAGLALLEQRLTALEEAYGIEILWREEAATVVPWEGYSFITEYLTMAYEWGIGQLEAAMAHFPTDFFQKAAQWTGNPLRLVLVRGIYGNQDQGTLSSAPCIQYQLEGRSYLALSMTAGMEQAFYHGVSHVIETRVLSTCTAYYEWNTQNPKGFQYDNDYIANQNRQDTQYLQPENRYFIDMYSMSFAIEDRARILEYACMPGKEAYFTSAVMAEKLRRVCAGIREAFQLPEADYLWEQYLGAGA